MIHTFGEDDLLSGFLCSLGSTDPYEQIFSLTWFYNIWKLVGSVTQLWIWMWNNVRESIFTFYMWWMDMVYQAGRTVLQLLLFLIDGSTATNTDISGDARFSWIRIISRKQSRISWIATIWSRSVPRSQYGLCCSFFEDDILSFFCLCMESEHFFRFYINGHYTLCMVDSSKLFNNRL